MHAEVSAVLQLLKNKKPKKKLIIDILVIRTNRKGELCCSKPCHHCLKFLMNIPNCIVKYIYYSETDGSIVKNKLTNLWYHDKHHISRGHKH